MATCHTDGVCKGIPNYNSPKQKQVTKNEKKRSVSLYIHLFSVWHQLHKVTRSLGCRRGRAKRSKAK
jgi:hypothetical protein